MNLGQGLVWPSPPWGNPRGPGLWLGMNLPSHKENSWPEPSDQVCLYILWNHRKPVLLLCQYVSVFVNKARSHSAVENIKFHLRFTPGPQFSCIYHEQYQTLLLQACWGVTGWKLERAKPWIHHINTLHAPPMQQMNTMKTEVTHSSVRAWNGHREGYTQSPHHTWIQQLLWLITITTAMVGPNITLLVTAIPTSYRSCQT